MKHRNPVKLRISFLCFILGALKLLIVLAPIGSTFCFFPHVLLLWKNGKEESYDPILVLSAAQPVSPGDDMTVRRNGRENSCNLETLTMD